MTRSSMHGDRPTVGELPVDEDVRREVEAHVAMRAEELIAEGWEPSAAREEALRLFGDVDEVKRMMERETRARDRAVRRGRFVEGIWHDVRFALRGLRRSPGYAIVALVTLALGIGANTAVFSVVHGVLMRPLPFPEPEELVWIREYNAESDGTMRAAWANFVDWRESTRTLEGLGAHQAFNTTVLGGEQPTRARLARISDGFWDVFPITPVAGRLTAAEEHVPGGEPVVVISERFWRNAFGAEPLDRIRLEVGGVSPRVVGVLPADFDFPTGADLWGPAEASPGATTNTSRSSHNWSAVGRLREGVGIEAASAELTTITERVLEDETGDPRFLADGVVVRPLRSAVTSSARQPLLLLLGAALLVLLIACTNLASTLLARGATRYREIAVRSSLGAGRARIVRQLFTEGLLLSLVGGVLAVGLARVVVDGVRLWGVGSVPRLEEVGVSAPVLGFALVATLLTAVAFGLLPALRLSRVELAEGLREGTRGNAGGAREGVWRLLIGAEVAFALVLLVGSGLMLRSFRSVVTVERGFAVEGVMTASISLSPSEYTDDEAYVRWYESTLSELESLPAVEAAGVVSTVPIGGGLPTGRLDLDGDLSKHAIGGYVVASRGFFEALDIPLLQGRLFDDRDDTGSPHVALVSRSFADLAWPGEDPVGRQVSGGGMDNFWDERPFATVVGVVADIRHADLEREPEPTVYFPLAQRPRRATFTGTIVAEAAEGSAAPLAPIMRDVLSRAESDLPLRLRSMEDIVRTSTAERRFVLSLLGAFALVAVLLAAVGVYGVVSYRVARRRREMGIRLALGAEPGAVRRMVILGSLGMVVGGLLVGSVGALLLTGLVEGLLYGVEARDPATFFASVGLLALAAVAASWIPALRSTRVDPVVTMRAE